MTFSPSINRRHFLGMSAAAAAALLVKNPMRGQSSSGTTTSPAPSAGDQAIAQPRIPRRRGFNLTELTGGHRGQSYKESDFQWMAEWGFDFARLPCSYWLWSDKNDWKKIDDEQLKPIDQAIAWGKQYNIHINLNFHRIPGYCVNGRELEPHQLFGGSEDDMKIALDAAVYHWRHFASRYKEISADRLSFDLFNEPPFMPDQSRYVEIAKALIAGIREESPQRLIVVDGADIGQTPVLGLIDQGIVQSTRGYLPKMVSHYTAKWVPNGEFESFEKPTWPMTDMHGVVWDREKLRSELIDKWKPLTSIGAPVHVGEWGCFTATPHDVMLKWMNDLLALWKEANWGWSMWNLRGGFGIVDSGRPDVKYEDFRGHQLDRELLELLRAN